MDKFEGKEFVMWRGYFRIGNKMLHRLIWEKANGPIPKNHVIHHRDGNKLNNSIENLECLSQAEHSRLHRLEERETLSARMSMNSEKVHAWLHTEKGKKFLSDKARAEFARRPIKDFICQQCNKPFQSKHSRPVTYCSDNCVMRARWARKADMEDRTCVICSSTFSINRYQLTKTCSFPCRNKLLSQTKLKKRLVT